MSTQQLMDEKFMRRCLELAQEARAMGEAAVGGVVVDGETIIGEGTESTRTLLDHSAHAEVLAIQAASQNLQSLKLNGTTLYTTVEPCVLCSWVIRKAGIARVVFGVPAGEAGGFTLYGTTHDRPAPKRGDSLQFENPFPAHEPAQFEGCRN